MDSAWRRLVSAIDGIKAQFTDGDSEDTADLPSTANSVPDQLANIRERVEPAHCQLSKIVRHGFPDSPKCIALQKLCVIGSCNGCVRLFGQVSPVAPTKLLIVFDRCQLVLWNIQTLEVDRLRLDDQPNSPVIAVSWHFDGKQLMAGHHDGSVSIWNVKKPHEMVQHSMPHGGMTKVQQNQQKHDNHKEKTSASAGDQQQQRHRSDNAANAIAVACKPITQPSWNVNIDGDQMIIFAGGMPMDEGALPSVTVKRAKGSLTLLEMNHPIVSMLPLHAWPYASAAQPPHTMAVLLRNDLLVVDMEAQGCPCFEVLHPMDLHESPVEMIKYFSDCPIELIAALTLVGRNQRRQGVRLSERPWPLNGGIGRECATGQQEMLLTGHEEGSIKFWQASSEQLQIMYKLKTGRHFEKNVAAHIAYLQAEQAANGGKEKALTVPVISHAVADVGLCLDSKQLLVVSRSGQVTQFLFAKTECCQEIATMVLPQLCRSIISATFSPTTAPPSPKNGVQQAPNGYQPELLCQIPWVNGIRSAALVTALALNSALGLIALGTRLGFALIDAHNAAQVYAWSNDELLGRAPIPYLSSSQIGEMTISPATEAHSNAITKLGKAGNEMIQHNHYEKDSIRKRLDVLHQLWDRLFAMLETKVINVQQTLKLLQCVRKCDEMLYWGLLLVSGQELCQRSSLSKSQTSPIEIVSSDNLLLGACLEFVEAMQRKFAGFFDELKSQESRVLNMNHGANALINEGQPVKQQIHGKWDEVKEAWHKMGTLTSTRSAKTTNKQRYKRAEAASWRRTNALKEYGQKRKSEKVGTNGNDVSARSLCCYWKVTKTEKERKRRRKIMRKRRRTMKRRTSEEEESQRKKGRGKGRSRGRGGRQERGGGKEEEDEKEEETEEFFYPMAMPAGAIVPVTTGGGGVKNGTGGAGGMPSPRRRNCCGHHPTAAAYDKL
ncbi:hypothetical protein niasHT_031461 [Heterodera trifolii]|uniref:Lethal giant larvae homologue 2 domain-containing protein n=1 Tax=Heterodera trifolii TaxID=157864 RepID=A0ABD2IRX3_9BILA